MSVSDITIRRPVFGWMLMLGLMLFGFISMTHLGISQLPNIENQVVSVSLSWEGAAPQVMESDIVDPVEQAIMGVSGIREITSNVRRGQATISVELELGHNVDVAVQEIQTKVAQAQRRLPDDMDPAVVSKRNPADQPIIWMTIRGEGRSTRELMSYVQDVLQDKFAAVSGVGEVFLGGFVEPNLRVWIDLDKLNALQLTITDVQKAINEEHVELPAGVIETDKEERNVRAYGEAISVKEFENIRIMSRGGAPIYQPIFLKDVARIEDGLADVKRISRSQGKTALGLAIRKQTGVNEVEVAKGVLKKIEEVRKELPSGMELFVTVNRTKYVEQSIHELQLTLVLSALATALVCWLFLGSLRATFNILLAIPTSMLGSFLALKYFGFTLNTMTILALSLAMGMVVDDAIMVLENITRYFEKGRSPEQAASEGAKQITLAALATTLAIIAIFIPVIFVQGYMGRMFMEFGVTLSVAVAISLVEALLFTPMRFAQLGNAANTKNAWGMSVDACFQGLAERYEKLLIKILLHRGKVVVSAIVFFIATLFLIGVLRKEIIPSQDQDLILMNVKTAVGSSIVHTDELFKKVETYLIGRPEIKSYYSSIGGSSGGESNRGNIFINLVPRNERKKSQQELMDIYRKELKSIEGVRIIMQDLSVNALSPQQRGASIELSIRGPHWETLIESVKKIEEILKKQPYLVDVDKDYQEGIKEVRVIPRRDVMALKGVNMSDVSSAINALIGGQVIGKYTENGRRYDIRVRLEAQQRLQNTDITKIMIRNRHGEMVSLGDLVNIEEHNEALSITRQGRERAITITASNARGYSQDKAIADAMAIVRSQLPDGYKVILSGNAKAAQESNLAIRFLMSVGFLVAYMILASQFNSYLHPVTILMAMPFSISGALLALFVTGQSLNVYSIIGILLLMGIVKKNSILLVEFTNYVRAHEGVGVKEALMKACPIRLRPILMTSAATLVAAIPTALLFGPGYEVRLPMAVTIIGGVIASTVLTLVVVPCVYLMLSRFERKPPVI